MKPERVRERERANGASGTRCDIDAAKRRSQTENWEVRVNQSKPQLKHVPECQRLTRLENRSRRESNTVKFTCENLTYITAENDK